MKNVKKVDGILVKVITIFSLLTFISSAILFAEDRYSNNWDSSNFPWFLVSIIIFSLLSFLFSAKPKNKGGDRSKQDRKEYLYCIMVMITFLFMFVYAATLQVMKDVMTHVVIMDSTPRNLIPYGVNITMIIFSFLGLKEFYRRLPPS